MERGLVGMTLGEYIKQRRGELGLTQQELADRMGWTDVTRISRAEQGHSYRRFPDPDEVRFLARHLETTPEKILKAVGYIEADEDLTPERRAATVFTLLADELRQTPDLNPEVRETALDLLRHMKRLQEGVTGGE